jgi:ribosome recycling factor
MIKDLLKEEEVKMKKALDSLKGDLSAIRTGRASPALVEQLQVEAYGGSSPLIQLATISAPEARLITIRPFDASTMPSIEKAILKSDLGLTPNNDGQLIRLQVPELTEERRRQLVKVVRGLCEEGKVAVRNIRRDVMHDLRELRDMGEAGSDDEHRAEEALQKLTDEKVHELEDLLKGKEAEILEV